MTAVLPEGPVARGKRLLSQRVESPLDISPAVGKDILELVSSAMYVDPRAIYREYVQNSADAIDAAFQAGLYEKAELARIDIWLDQPTRRVRIADNGVGIQASDAARVLTSFGASAKRGTTARGFRGVGRLAALGYAQAVIFRTKAAGEPLVTEVHWDCRRIRSGLSDPHYSGDLAQLVRESVTVSTEHTPARDAHFFEVDLTRIIRVRNDLLLHPDEIREYLGEVAPVPFAASFPFGRRIDADLRAYVPEPRFRIYLNGSTDHITRPHQRELSVTRTKVDHPTDVSWFSLPDGNGGVRAVGWILHHNYLGALHGANSVRGLRARIGDLQVGDDKVFLSAFPEERFNSWTVGEFHILDRSIIPNGRRDGFEQSAAFADLLSQLGPVARELAKRCRHTSGKRTRLRAFSVRADRLRSLLDVLKQRGITRTRITRTRNEIGKLLAEMRRLTESQFLDDTDRQRLQRSFRRLVGTYEGLGPLVENEDPLAGVAANRRAIYSEVLDMIIDVAPSQTVARRIIDRILARVAAASSRDSRKHPRRNTPTRPSIGVTGSARQKG